MIRIARWIFVAGLSSLLAGTASAQKIDVQHFQPATSLQGLDSTKGGRSEAPMDLTLGGMLVYGHDYLVLVDDAGHEAESLVGDRLDLLLSANVGLPTGWDPTGLIRGLDVGAVLPLVLVSHGSAAIESGVLSTGGATTAGLGNPRLQARVTLLTVDQVGIDLAVIPVISLPWSAGGAYLGDRTVAFTPEIAVSKPLSFLLFAANVGYRTRPNFKSAYVGVSDQITWRAGVWADLGGLDLISGAQVGVEAFGLAKAARPFRKLTQTPTEILLSGRYRVGDTVLTGGVGTGITSGYGAPEVQIFLGGAFAPRVFDEDHDGILDDEDACPSKPEDRDAFEDEDGCPEPDNDRDGVLDTSDKCPLEPEDADGFEDADGCPDSDNDQDGILDARDQCPSEPEDVDTFQDLDGCPDLDNDGDKIPDVTDKCPLLPEDFNGNQDEDGCPDAADDQDGDGIADVDDACPKEPEDLDQFQDEDGCPDLDNDEDGIPDSKDRCPLEKEDVDQFMDEDGCPEDDNDGDGIWDKVDKCPNESEVVNGIDDDDGCPDEGAELVRLTRERIEIKDKVYFETGSDVIRDRSFDLLNQVAALLANHAEVKRLQIEGHTDDRGPEFFNQDLSARRAEAVKKYLVGKGVAADRLVAVGMGESKPIASNRSARGREMNRRVEFNIIPQEPTPQAPTPDVQEPPASPPPLSPIPPADSPPPLEPAPSEPSQKAGDNGAEPSQGEPKEAAPDESASKPEQ